MQVDKIKVNSWNEWDPLKHVIVGKADGTCIPAPEPALDAKVPEDSDMRGQYGPRTKDTVDKANELLNNFSSMLEKRGIKVDRPTPINFNQLADLFIESKKSALFLVFFNFAIKNSIPSIVPIGLIILLSTFILERSSFSNRSSSLLVPDLVMSSAG